MARDSSPFSQRLKALAVRAGLPVDAGQTPIAGPPDDEQPTGEFAAAANADTPAEDRPTGEFPALTRVPDPLHPPAPPAPAEGVASHVESAEPDPAALPAPPPPIWGQPSPPSGAAVPPPLRHESASTPSARAPIWTDSPPESQSPLTSAGRPADGPTLDPPTLSTPAEPEAAPTLDPPTLSTPAEPEAAPTLDPPTLSTPAEPEAAPTLDPPTLSTPAQLDEALALPDSDDDAAPSAPAAATDSQGPEADRQPGRSADGTVDRPEPIATPDPEPMTSAFGGVAIDGDDHEAQAAASAGATPATPEAPAGSGDQAGTTGSGDEASEDDETPAAAAETAQPIETPEPASATPSVRDRLSLTGRIASLRRRVKPDVDAPTETAGDHVPGPDEGVEPEPGSPAVSVAATPETATPETATLTTATTAAPEAPKPEAVTPKTPEPKQATPARSEPLEIPPPAKPSFSERAALRRRVKTLRARRDTGLLELGAIVLDQRRFGDPTAGALLRRRTDELADLDNEIAAIEHALDDHASAAVVAALGELRCIGCNSLVGPADRYCAHCGTPRPVSGPPASDGSADPRS